MEIQWKLLKNLMARISELKKPASHLVKMSRSKPELSQLTPLALIQERSSNRMKLVHNKKITPPDLTQLLPLSAYQKNFKGNLTCGKSW